MVQKPIEKTAEWLYGNIISAHDLIKSEDAQPLQDACALFIAIKEYHNWAKQAEENLEALQRDGLSRQLVDEHGQIINELLVTGRDIYFWATKLKLPTIPKKLLRFAEKIGCGDVRYKNWLEEWLEVLGELTNVSIEVEAVTSRFIKPKEGGPVENWHNDDFTKVIWNGERYAFNKTQARVIEYLLRNKRASEESIGEYIGSDNEYYRLRHTFRQKKGNKSVMHPAWGTMIVNDGKGIYALSKKNQESSEK